MIAPRTARDHTMDICTVKPWFEVLVAVFALISAVFWFAAPRYIAIAASCAGLAASYRLLSSSCRCAVRLRRLTIRHTTPASRWRRAWRWMRATGEDRFESIGGSCLTKIEAG